MAALVSMPLRFLRASPIRQTAFARTSLQLQTRLIGTRQTWNRSVLRASRTPIHESYVRDERTTARSHPGSQVLRRTRTFASNTPLLKPIAPSQASILQSNEPRTTSYLAPTTGLLSYLPTSWIPYAELIRLDKPTGTYYLFFPCLFSTLLAAPLAHPIPGPYTVCSTATLFLLGALIMRGAGCTINDLWDRDLDPHVERTRHRPIARGAITVQQAIPFLGVQLLAGLGVLVSFPSLCLWYGIPSLLLVTTYPLAKRVTNYPQFVLGLTFSWGAIMGFPALGIDLLSGHHTASLVSAACLYASCVAWTVVYDMIYAYQDIRDDAVAGIKSIALAQQSRAKAFLASVAALQVALLAGAGIAAGAGPAFFAGSCGGAAITLGAMIKMVDLESVQDCWRWFKRGAWLTGGAVTLGLAGEYGTQYLASEGED